MAMKLKTDEDGHVVVQDGKPVYVDDDGKDHVYDAPAMQNSLRKFNGELADARKERDEARETLTKFEGVDPEAARKALNTVKNLDDKKLVDAGEVDKIKQETAAGYQKQLDEAKRENQSLKDQYGLEKVSGAFAGSKFVKEKLAVPPDMVQRTFAHHFEYKDGRITPKDANGNPIYSDANPGDVASFDEALEKIVSQYPHRESIMKGTGNSGTGGDAVDESGVGKRTVTREQFDAMPASRKAEIAKAANEGKVALQD